MREAEKPDQPPTIVMVECSMCHVKVPFARTTLMSGRRLCLDCANSWFDDEDDGEKSG